jgi:nucleotide-binding universal stress UspA family protein
MTRDARDAATDARPFCLLVALTLTEEGRHAFADAVRIARRIPGCVLHVVHVAVALDTAKDPAIEAAVVRAHVDQMLAALGGSVGLEIAIDLRTGDPVKALTAFAHELAADLVVLGSDRGHRASFDRAPTAERLGEAISCPVVVTAHQLLNEPS